MVGPHPATERGLMTATKFWHRWATTICFLILAVGFTTIAVRQQNNFDDHERIVRVEDRRICSLLQSRWDVVNEIIEIEAGEPDDSVHTNRLKYLNGARPECTN